MLVCNFSAIETHFTECVYHIIKIKTILFCITSFFKCNVKKLQMRSNLMLIVVRQRVKFTQKRVFFGCLLSLGLKEDSPKPK